MRRQKWSATPMERQKVSDPHTIIIFSYGTLNTTGTGGRLANSLGIPVNVVDVLHLDVRLFS